MPYATQGGTVAQWVEQWTRE